MAKKPKESQRTQCLNILVKVAEHDLYKTAAADAINRIYGTFNEMKLQAAATAYAVWHALMTPIQAADKLEAEYHANWENKTKKKKHVPSEGGAENGEVTTERKSNGNAN